MSEDRLIEITSAINNADSFISAMVYLTNLNEDDINVLIGYISDSKYNNMDFLSAIVMFSKDYLKSKGLYKKPDSNEFTEQMSRVHKVK